MATIYWFDSGEICSDGLQSSRVCDEAIQTARRIARDHGKSVIVEDGGTKEHYRITPAGHRWRVPKGWVASWDAEPVDYDESDWRPARYAE